LNINTIKSKLLSPLSIINLVFLVFAVPAIYQVLTLGVLLPEFYELKNNFGYHQTAVILFSFIIVNVLYSLAPKFNFYFKPVLISHNIHIMAVSIQFFIFIICFILFNIKYDYFGYINSIFTANSVPAAYKVVAEFGYNLINDGGLFFYTVLYFVPIFFAALSLNVNNRILRNFFLIFSVGGIFLYSLAGRRELLLLIPIIAILVSKENKYFFFKMFGAAIALIAISTLLLLARIKSDGFNLDDYLGSQEFYPFTYGSLLVVEYFNYFEFNEFLKLFPFYVLSGEDNLSFYTRKLYFNYYSNGPTVTIVYPLIAFFPFSAFLLLGVFSVMKRLHYMIFIEKKEDLGLILLYSFLIIKLFLLIRNGEVGLFFWDLIFFFIMLSPVLLLRSSK
jgi:hypothetical protein